MKNKIIAALLLLGVVACQHDISEDSQPVAQNYTANDQGEVTGETVILGDKRDNAYSVVTMQKAFDYYNALYSDSPFQGRKVEATHLYIKLKPAVENDLLKLEEMAGKNDEYFISEYPMEYEVLQEGSDYTDPSYSGKTEYKPLYMVIGINQTVDVPYDVIDKLYEPTDEEFHIETIALAMSNWQDDLVADFGVQVTMANVNDYIGAPANETARSNWFSSLFGRKFTPKGYIKLFNYDNNGEDPLMNANINTGRSFWWRGTHTDETGYFEATKRYRGKVRIRSAWRNTNSTERMTWYEIIGIQVSDHVMTETRGNNNRTYVIKNVGDDERLWCKGTVYNGLVKYNKYCDTYGISKVNNSNVWVSKTGKDASTPMMHTYPSLLSTAVANYSLTNSGFFNGLALSVEMPVTNLIQIAFPHLLPDQLFNGIKTRGTTSAKQSNKVVEELVFHESGHFSHALKCGVSTYALVVGAEAKNSSQYNSDPYNNGQTPTVAGGKMIALAEGWATYMENRCMQNYFGSSYDSNATRALPGYIESFQMQAVPYTGSRTDAISWFSTGLMWDITDSTGTEASPSGYYTNNGVTLFNSIVDAVNLGSSPAIIYVKLTSDVQSASQLKTKLTQGYPSQATALNNLFTSYGQ